MKNGKRPNVRQCKFLEANGYDPSAWLIVKDTPVEMVIVSRTDNATTVSIKKIEY